MKIYKGVILTIMLGLGILSSIASMSAYDGQTNLIILALLAGGIWFNWQYAIGHLPRFNLLTATCVGWAIGATSVLVVINFFADKYHREFGEVVAFFWDKTPNIFISPVIIAPLSVLFWRWIFKEVREVNKTSTNTTI